MKLSRFLIISCLLWLWMAPLAFAAGDTLTPRPESSLAAPPPTSPPELVPTSDTGPVSPMPDTTEPVLSPAPQPSGVTVMREHPAPAARATPAATLAVGQPRPSQSQLPSSSPRSGDATLSGNGHTDTSGTTSDLGAADSSQVIDVNADPGSYAAPSQLRCDNRKYPTSGPFLQSPFTGWASVNSFLDHDYPDYETDGDIVLANGLSATASRGQESDVFPAYWSTALRQYINYDGHNGYDYGISYQPVLAAAEGTVMFAGWNGPSEYDGYGRMVLINHHNGYVTLYGHLSSLEVRKGDQVVAGEEIGISGSTGHSSGPHLHFSVFHNCEVTDPYGWTGSRKDPLVAFDGEHASYLWLPGHDPLVLNSPPNWPSYPLGLRVAIPPSALAGRLPRRTVPPVDRLLLLNLPAPPDRDQVSAGVALARAESIIYQEIHTLTPYLDDLETEGLVEKYQLVPAAAAIWVRGTASSQQLEELPGVASLSGVKPGDLQAGQAGLAHSVLIQLGPQQAPSLWPVGFRSALHPWRPVITAVNRHALVEGFALPGQHVIVALERSGQIPGAAQATGDAQTGGFVAMIQGPSGQPVAVRSGDLVRVQTGGRQASVRVSALMLRVHARIVSGLTRPGATIPISVIKRGSERLWHTVATADRHGKFAANVPNRLPSGSLAVASITDSAGDQESASSYVPGFIVDLSAGTVAGWAVGRAPELQIWRGGKQELARAVEPSEDGTYRLALSASDHSFAWHPGDIVSVGSRWHRHRLVVPGLTVRLRPRAKYARLSGPPYAPLSVEVLHAGAQTDRSVVLNGRGQGMVAMPAPIGIGDAVRAGLSLPSGDSLLASARVDGVVIHVGSGAISGHTVSSATVNLRLYAASGRKLAGALAQSYPDSGSYRARLQTDSGHRVRVSAGTRLVIVDTTGALSVSVPRLEVKRSSDGRLVHIHADAPAVMVTLVDRNGRRHTRRLGLDATGQARLQLTTGRHLKSVVVATPPSHGISFERTVHLDTTVRTCTAAKKSTASCAKTLPSAPKH